MPIVLFAGIGILAGQAPPDAPKPLWRDKQIPDWSEDDAKQLLADSPWARKSVAAVDPALDKQPKKEGGRRGAFGIAGLGRRVLSNGGNHPAESGPAPGTTQAGSSSSSSSATDAANKPSGSTLMFINLRWASALPIREAELKAKDVRAPMVDEAHYAIVVYGVPARFVKDNSKKIADQLKALAALKRRAKDDLQPSSVEIEIRDDGPVVVYLFPRTTEITWRDHQIDFEAQIGALKIKQSFDADDMTFHGKLEL